MWYAFNISLIRSSYILRYLDFVKLYPNSLHFFTFYQLSKIGYLFNHVIQHCLNLGKTNSNIAKKHSVAVHILYPTVLFIFSSIYCETCLINVKEKIPALLSRIFQISWDLCVSKNTILITFTSFLRHHMFAVLNFWFVLNRKNLVEFKKVAKATKAITVSQELL